MADRIRIQLGLEIDTKTQKVNVNPKLIEQAVARAMKNVNIPDQEIKTRLNIKPEISAVKLQKTISDQLKQVNSVIADETGKFSKAAKTSAEQARRELDSAFTLLSPDKTDKKFPGTFKGLLERVKSDGFDINALNKLTDKQSADLNRYVSKVKAQQSRLSEFQARANKLAQVGFATGTPSLLPTSFLSGVGAAAANLGVEAKALGDKLNVGKQQAAADKIDRDQRIESNKAAALQDKQDRATLAEQKKIGAGDQSRRKFEQNRTNLQAEGIKKNQTAEQQLASDRIAQVKGFVKNENAERKANDTEARRSLAKFDKSEKKTRDEAERKQKSNNKETLASQTKIGEDHRSTLNKQRKLKEDQAEAIKENQRFDQKKIDAVKAQAKEFLKKEAAERKADTASARTRLDKFDKDQKAALARAVRVQKSQALNQAAHNSRVLKAHAAALVENVRNSKAKAKLAAAEKASSIKEQAATKKQIAAQNAEKRLSDRKIAGEKLVAEGTAGGFRNVTSVAQGRLAKDALKQRRDELQQNFASQKSQGLSAVDLKSTTQALKQNDRALSSLENRMASFGSVTKQVGALVGQFLRFAVGYQVLYQAAAAVTALARSLVDLDSELIGIKAIAGASASELNEIEGAIKRVAVSTKFTIDQVAKAARLLAQSGVKPEDIREVLAATANFAAATGSSLDQAADLLSTMRNVFKDLDAVAISDKLTTAINISKLTASDLTTILGISAQIAKSYELTADQYLAAVATLRNAGLKASTVATGLRQGILEVFSPDSKTLAALKKRYSEIGEVLTDAAIKTRFAAFQNEANPLVAALNELKRLGFNDEGSLTFQRSFDIRAENAIRALIDNIDELAVAQAKLNFGGSALLGSEIQLQSLSATVENLGAAISVLADSLTDGAIPSLQAFLAEAVKTVNKLTDLNDGLKADTGSGLITTIAAALGVGGIVFAKGKGSVLQRAGTGAVAAAATFQAGPAVTRGADSVGISVSDVLAVGSISAVAVQAVKFILDKTPLGRAARNARAASRAPVVAAGGITRGRGAPAPLADAGSIAAVGIFLQSIFSVASAVFTKIKAKGGLLRIAASLLTKINPITAVITGLVSVLVFANSFGKKQAKEISKFNQRLQNIQSSAAEVSELSNEADDFRFTSLDSGLSGEGTSARAVEDLSDAFDKVDRQVDQFLNAKTDDISDILKQLSRSGSSVGSSSRNNLLRDLASRLEGDVATAVLELTGAQDVLSDEQVKLSRAISAVADGYSAAEASTIGLQQRMFQQFNHIKDLGDQASAGERAFAKNFQAALSGANFNLLIKGITDKPRDLLNLQTSLFQATETVLAAEVDKAKAKSKAEFDKLLQQFAVVASSSDDILDVDALLTSLRLSANKLGLSSEDLFNSLRAVLDDAAENLRETGRGGIGRRRPGTRADRGKQGELNNLGEVRKLVDQTETLENRQRVAGFDKFEKEQRRTVQGIKDDLDLATKEGIEGALVDEIRGNAQGLLDILASGGTFSEKGKLKPGSEELLRPATLTDIQNLRTSIQENSSRKADVRTAETKADLTISRTSKEDAIQADLNRLGREEIKERRIGLVALHQNFLDTQAAQKQQIAISIANNAEEIKKATADSSLTNTLEGLLVERAALLTKSNQLTLKQTSDRDEAEIQLTASITRLKLSLDKQNIADQRTGIGALEGDPIERGRLQAISQRRGVTLDERRNVLGRELNQGIDSSINLKKNIAFTKTDTSIGSDERVDKLRDLNAELITTQEQLGNTKESLDQLNTTPVGELKEAFNFESLVAGLEQANGGLENMAENIRGPIIAGLSNMGATMNQAARDGENLGDALKKTFSSILDGIADLIANLAIQAAVASIFKAIIGFKGGTPDAGDAGGLKTGSSNVETFAGGGIIKGPGTGTSDSVPGLILDKNGKVRKPVLVSDGEAILTARATNIIGPDFINSLNDGKFSKFQSGGLIGRSTDAVSNVESPAIVTAEAVTANNTNQAGSDDSSLSIVNIVDKNLFEDYINSPEGSKSMINTISTNSETIKQVLR